jgi:adenylate kinase
VSVLFVGGVHGVGKSSTCRQVAEQVGVVYRTASEILRTKGAAAVSRATKVVADLDANQQLLISGVEELSKNGSLLLDGHFTLLTPNGVEPIPISVFSHLGLGAIALFTDEPGRIADRLLARDGRAPALDQLAEQQAREISHARLVAQSMSLEVLTLNAFDQRTLSDAVVAWLPRCV